MIEKSTTIELASVVAGRTETAETQHAKRAWVKPAIRSYDTVIVTEGLSWHYGDGLSNQS